MKRKPETLIHNDFHYGDVEHAHYEKKGYYIFENFLSDEAIDYCREQLDRMLGELKSDFSPDMMIGTHQLGEQWISDLAIEPRLLDLVERHIGPNIVLWASHLLIKQPHTGRPVPWHQDAPYWNISGPFSGSVWVPFDNIDDENGSMSIIPGWHNKGTLKKLYRDKEFKEFSEEIDPEYLPENIDQVKVKYLMSAGQMAIHHTMLPHNSVPNKSDRWRRVLVLRYMVSDCQTNDMEYEDYRTGEKFPRQYYLVRGKDLLNQGLNTDLLHATVKN